MSAGLFGLLDDVAALARLAAASVDDVGAAAGRASVKAAGVVVDDTAVTPQYVHGVAAERELPIIKKIAVGLAAQQAAVHPPGGAAAQPVRRLGLLTPLLMVGGTYLCYEGAEKIWERLIGAPRDARRTRSPASPGGPTPRTTVVAGAIRTDFILSAEIMVIALNEVADEPFVSRAVILVVVAFAHHRPGLRRGRADREDGRRRPAPGRQRGPAGSQAVGRGLVAAMPSAAVA